MRSPKLVGVLSVFVVLLIPLGSARTVPNGVFVSTDGPRLADVSIVGPCNGEVTITVVLDPVVPGGAPESRVLQAESLMVPDLCLIACFECVVPFAWTITNESLNVKLVGGGVVPGGASLQGAFQEGALQVRSLIV